MNGEDLAQYYVEQITTLANKVKVEKVKIKKIEESITQLGSTIDYVEIRLREKITNILEKETGQVDFEEILTGVPKRDIRNRVKMHLEKHPDIKKEDFMPLRRAIHFTDINHLKKIILKEDRWPYFEDYFKTKKNVEKYFDQLAALRHVIKHNRELTDLILHEGKAAITWLGNVPL